MAVAGAAFACVLLVILAIFPDKAGPLHFSHERYLVNQLRKRFGFEGTPIELKSRGRVKRSESKPLR